MSKKFALAAFVATVATVLASAANAVTYTYSDSTVGGATWNRPVTGNPPNPPASTVGTDVPYHVFQFQVDTAGSYDFLSTSLVGWDNYLFLYHTSFQPLDPFNNVIIGNDDFPNIGVSGFNGVNLTNGADYFLITTGFSNSDDGEFRNSITGPGNVNVPEPVTASLAAVALTAAGLVLCRRR